MTQNWRGGNNDVKKSHTRRKWLLGLLQQMVLTNNSTRDGEDVYCIHLSVYSHHPLPIHHLDLVEGIWRRLLIKLRLATGEWEVSNNQKMSQWQAASLIRKNKLVSNASDVAHVRYLSSYRSILIILFHNLIFVGCNDTAPTDELWYLSYTRRAHFRWQWTGCLEASFLFNNWHPDYSHRI